MFKYSLGRVIYDNGVIDGEKARKKARTAKTGRQDLRTKGGLPKM
jgi:hypothetical protein